MKSQIRILTQIFFTSWIAVGVNIAHAEGSAGARGGGTGIICRAETQAVTLEQNTLTRNGIAVDLPSDRENVLKWIAMTLRFNPEFRDAFIARWTHIGAYGDWKPISKQEVVTALIGREQSSLLTQLSNLLAELDPSNSSPSGNALDSLVGDDYFETPDTCRKVQLSLLLDGVVSRVTDYRVTEKTKRFLEIHEALYDLGMDQYHHQLPVLTRSLIVAMNAKDHFALKLALDAFIQGDPPAVFAPAPNPFHKLHEVMVLSNYSKDFGQSCPLAISFVSEGDTRRATFFELLYGKLIPVTREGRQRSNREFHQSVTFQEGPHAIFQGAYDDFTRIDTSTFKLEASRDRFFEEGAFHETPDAQKLMPATAGVVGDCIYTVLRLDTPLDSANVMKAWNSFLWSH